MPCGRRARAVAITGSDATNQDSVVGDVDTKELEALNLLNYSPVDENGDVLGHPFPVVHNNFLCLGSH